MMFSRPVAPEMSFLNAGPGEDAASEFEFDAAPGVASCSVPGAVVDEGPKSKRFPRCYSRAFFSCIRFFFSFAESGGMVAVASFVTLI